MRQSEGVEERKAEIEGWVRRKRRRKRRMSGEEREREERDEGGREEEEEKEDADDGGLLTCLTILSDNIVVSRSIKLPVKTATTPC